jgi:hypothetical protein
MRLDPFYPAFAPLWSAFAYYMLKQYSKALPLVLEAVARAPNLHSGHLLLAATCMQLGKPDEARKAALDVLRTHPAFTLESFSGFFARMWKRQEDAKHAAHIFDALRKAGLPE